MRPVPITPAEIRSVAKAICGALGDEWSREGPAGLMEVYSPAAQAAIAVERRELGLSGASVVAPLGRRQLRMLMLCASPYGYLVTTDKVSDSLVRRGLLRERDDLERSKYDGRRPCCITPAGYRALAAEMEAGRIDAVVEEMRKKREAGRPTAEADDD